MGKGTLIANCAAAVDAVSYERPGGPAQVRACPICGTGRLKWGVAFF
jgi:hypothetical protein